jgi:hypothetical protein
MWWACVVGMCRALERKFASGLGEMHGKNRDKRINNVIQRNKKRQNRDKKRLTAVWRRGCLGCV